MTQAYATMRIIFTADQFERLVDGIKHITCTNWRVDYVPSVTDDTHDAYCTVQCFDQTAVNHMIAICEAYEVDHSIIYA